MWEQLWLMDRRRNHREEAAFAGGLIFIYYAQKFFYFLKIIHIAIQNVFCYPNYRILCSLTKSYRYSCLKHSWDHAAYRLFHLELK